MTGLLDRDRELAAIGDLLAACRAEQGALVAIEGHAGIGKTSLIEAALAAAAGIEVLRARGSDLERGLAFGVALQLFERRVRAAPEPERRALLEGPAALAAPLLDGSAGDPPAAGEDLALPLIHGLFWLTLNLSARGPLLLAVDDLHWADGPSLRMLAYLAARLDELGIGVLLAWRPGEPGADDELRERVSADPRAIELRPKALGVDSTATLIGRVLGVRANPALAAECLEATGGVPLYVEELAAEIARSEASPHEVSAELLATLRPAGIARAIRIRLGTLSAAAVSLAHAAAALGEDAAIATVAAAAGLERQTALAAAAELEAIGLLAGVDPPRFRHPVVREAIYAELTEAQRMSLHASGARVLHDHGASAEQVTAQLERCDPLGEPWALDALRTAAAEALARGAPATAVSRLRRALGEALPGDRGEVLVELGMAEVAAGTPAAAETMRAALEQTDEPRSRMTAWLELGRTLGLQLRAEEAARAFEGGIEDLTPIEPQLARILEADVITWALTFAPMRSEADERIERIAATSPRPDQIGDRLVLASLALDAALREAPLARAGALAEDAIGDGRLLAEVGPATPPFQAACTALAICGRINRADQLLAAAEEDARRRGSLRGLVATKIWRGWVLWRAGRLAEAEDAARDALEQPAGIVAVVRPVAVATLAQCQIERGELDEAATHLAQVPVDQMLGLITLLEPVLEARARLALERGELKRALADLDLLRESEERRHGLPLRLTFRHPWCAQALAAAARAEPAKEIADEALDAARAADTPLARASAQRARGLAASGEEALDALRAAVDELAGTEAALDRARALVELGAALRRRGGNAEARATLARGLDEATRCSASALANRARRELVDAGARPRRAAISGVEALTARELQICRAAARGLSNREIAAGLFVSPKTVQSHLRTAYRKLGIAGRDELAAALARRS